MPFSTLCFVWKGMPFPNKCPSKHYFMFWEGHGRASGGQCAQTRRRPCLVAGAWGDCSKDLHSLVQICAESKVDHLCRSTGRPELEGQLSVIVSQYRRLLSTCIVRAQAQCLLSRVGVISPQARQAAQRREVAGRMERQLREDRQAQWMASLRGPGWARQGRCHMLI